MKLEHQKKEFNVLVADDNTIQNQVIKCMLGIHNCNVSTAVDGIQAIKLYESGTFDLIISDIHMPIMDGRETVQYLKENIRMGRL
ncbi:MAG: response regulator [Flavobacteriales bacterium]|nr:response regulator [Flavobacteriales bacterium]